MAIFIEADGTNPIVFGMNLAVEIGGGIEELTIGRIDMATGTIFDGNHTGNQQFPPGTRRAFWGISSDPELNGVTIPSLGLPATVEPDATGLKDRQYDFVLSGVLGSPTALLTRMPIRPPWRSTIIS